LIHLCLKQIVLTVCFILAVVCTHSIAAEFPILSGDIQVTAIQQGDPDDFMFTLTVTHGASRFILTTGLNAGINDLQGALMTLKQTIGWKGNYLFVREECEGGNIWRCNLDHVFTLRKGRLIYIGEIAGGAERTVPGSFYNDGYFKDVYNKLECNDLTSHAKAPAIWLFIQEKGGHFHVNLHRTWQANRQQFLENMTEIQSILIRPGKEPPELPEIADLLLFNAALTKYCKRYKEFNQTIRIAKEAVDESVPQILQLIADVVPGELPEKRGSVKQLHTDTRTK
jgi:hypothetical protein